MSPQLIPDHDHHSGQPHVITIGNFDGVHRGHQHLIELVVSAARSRGARSAVITFDPLPLEVLRPDLSLPRLTTTQDRLDLIRAHSVDNVVPIQFNSEVAALEAPAFVRQVVDALRPIEIIVGGDFAFGHNRSGNADLLRDLGNQYGYMLRDINRIGDEHQDFSSSRIRTRLAEGDVGHAAEVLGRPFFVRGTVEAGKRRGRELGFPTANLAIIGNVAIPADGIYAALTQTRRGNALIPSMVYVGTNPTFDDHTRAVEVNLLHFDDDLYGSELTVVFAERVRGDQRFGSAQELIDQMHRDQEVSERILGDLDDRWAGDDLRVILGLGKGALTGDR